MKDSLPRPNNPKGSPDLTATRSNLPSLELLGTLSALSILLWILRAPTAPLGLAYYDDGETLYHILSLLSGQIPYRADISHHFLGYILPFVLGAKVFGFSLELIRQTAFIIQLGTALGVFLSMRLLVGFLPSLLAALICLSLRQPAVVGFYQQYEINFFTAFIIYFALRYCLHRTTYLVVVSSLLSGIAFTFDQRALALALIPFAALLLAHNNFKVSKGAYSAIALGFLFPVLFALLWITKNGALLEFWQQTFVFPFRYRAGSLGFSEILKIGISNHVDLLRDCSIACVTAIVGFAALARDFRLWSGSGEEKSVGSGPGSCFCGAQSRWL